MASDGEEMLIANYDGAEFDPAPAMVHGESLGPSADADI